ncbi:hypothetical protein J6590_055377 [Homalodisca vitripennis]|nr:hypothetical protein J6590_055377 [Homalodisca vitripennis]
MCRHNKRHGSIIAYTGPLVYSPGSGHGRHMALLYSSFIYNSEAANILAPPAVGVDGSERTSTSYNTLKSSGGTPKTPLVSSPLSGCNTILGCVRVHPPP